MKISEKDKEELKEFLKEELGLSIRSMFYFDMRISSEFSVRADLLIGDGDRRIVIGLFHKPSWDSLAQLLLIRELDKNLNEIMVASKIVPDSIRKGADHLKIGILDLPNDIFIEKETRRPRGKLTSEKAWRIIIHLMRKGPCSIRSISISEDISYGWTHGVITNLISRGLVERRGDLVELTNLMDLMNAAAWERPLKDMESYEIHTSFDSPHDLARTLSDWSERRGDPVVITAYMAATLQFGLGRRGDLIHCYADDERTRKIIKREFSGDMKDGVRLKVLLPDRDVISRSEVNDGVRVSSREQTLLDVAGLGYSGRDLLIEMVRTYGANST